MFNIYRRHGVLILIIFVLFVGQCYFVFRKSSPSQHVESKAVLVENESFKESPYVKQEYQQLIDEEPIEQPIQVPDVTERYQLMDRYANDRIDSAIDPSSFKRILFWNEVSGVCFD